MACGRGAERHQHTIPCQSSLANTTSTILTLLSTGANAKKSLPLIITLSSFDLYTSRPRQALLYVLLDAVQAGSYTPGLCVVGMTSRLDTTDLLEKRVRSRFGGRTINVWPEDMWVDVMKRTLLAGLFGEDTQAGKDFDEAWASEVETLCSDKKVLALLGDCKAISNDVRTLHRTLVSGQAWGCSAGQPQSSSRPLAAVPPRRGNLPLRAFALGFLPSPPALAVLFGAV